MTTDSPKEELAFNEICSHLNDLQDHVLEIEILSVASCPPGPPRILRDGNCIGIPKTLLIPAFKHALDILALGRSPQVGVSAVEKDAHKDEISRVTIPIEVTYSQTTQHLRLKATAIVLLLAPEHLTAANIRKRHLQQLASTSVLPSQDPHVSEHLAHALHHELNLLDSLQTSPLHRHAKSPTLWSHRRWIMATIPAPAILDGRRGMEGEYEIVHRAAGRHARNYVAFDYLRRRMRGAQGLDSCADEGEGESGRGKMIVAVPIETLAAHALSNPSDTSRLSFLQHVLHLHTLHAHHPPDHNPTTTSQASNVAASTVQHILTTALDLRLRGAAIWNFLRLALMSQEGAGVGEGERLEMLRRLREWRDGAGGGGGGGGGGEAADANAEVEVDANRGVYARDLSELCTAVDRSLRWIAAKGVDLNVDERKGGGDT